MTSRESSGAKPNQNTHMKISITASEAEKGEKRIKLSPRNETEIQQAVIGKRPMRASGTDETGRNISVIIPKAIESRGNNHTVLIFSPAWSRCFTVADSESKQITHLYCSFSFGQFQFAPGGVSKIRFSDSGPGVDQKTVAQAELALGELIEKFPSNPAVCHVIEFLRAAAEEGGIK